MLQRVCLTLALALLFAQAPTEARPLMVGICGGSGSGKTTMANAIAKVFGDEVSIVTQDCYYKDFSHIGHAGQLSINFDHPDSIDWDLLRSDLEKLIDGEAICPPKRDFSTLAQLPGDQTLQASRIIVVEGILIFAVPEIRKLFDVRIFVDTDSDIRLLRRIKRDTLERGQSFEEICTQWEKTVNPMYWEFIEPSKRYAELIIPEGGHYAPATKILISHLRNHLEG